MLGREGVATMGAVVEEMGIPVMARVGITGGGDGLQALKMPVAMMTILTNRIL